MSRGDVVPGPRRGRGWLRLLGLLAGLLVAIALLPGPSRAETQRLELPAAPRWYFVSLQVAPIDPSPEEVFPVGGGFDYDHLWSYDGEDGWRHFSPRPELGRFNDLRSIEPLRGYWIHVTSVPAGGLALPVDGDPALRLALEGADWHPVGPLLAPGSAPRNVSTVFQTVSDSLGDRIAELWGFRPAEGRFHEIGLASFDADCSAAPELCLAPGAGYWMRTTGDFEAGQEFRVSSTGVLLSGSQPLQRIRVSYEGAGSAVGTLAPAPSASALAGAAQAGGSTPLRWVAAQESFVGDEILYQADPEAAPPSAPASQVDLGNDGTLEPCPDLCGGAPDCLNLCFQNDGQEQNAFLSIPTEELSGLAGYSTLEPGRQLATLQLTVDDGRGAAVRSLVPVAVKPPSLVGEYEGVLAYENESVGVVPIRLHMDDRAVVDGQRSLGTGQVTAVLNPRVVGSNANGLDDDGDREIDEDDEQGGTFQVRDAPGFPAQTILRGSALGDSLRLQGERSLFGPGEGPAPATCDAGQCSDGSGRCLVDADCPRDAGVLGLFGSAGSSGSRSLRLEGRRSAPLTFVGTFVDRFDEVGLEGAARLAARGRFTLSRVRTAQCVVRDPGASRSLPLGISCQTDADCPFRCTGGEAAGLGCTPGDPALPTDCACAPLPCRFQELADAGAGALEYESYAQDVDVAGTFQGPVVVEILGLEDAVQVLDWPGESSADFGLIPACGSSGETYALRVSAACAGDDVVVTVPDLCAAPAAIELVGCDGDAPQAVTDATRLANGSVRVAGRFSLLGSAPTGFSGGAPVAGPVVQTDTGGTVTLVSAGGIEALLGPDAFRTWTDLLQWPALASRLLAGPLAWITGGEEA